MILPVTLVFCAVVRLALCLDFSIQYGNQVSNAESIKSNNGELSLTKLGVMQGFSELVLYVFSLMFSVYCVVAGYSFPLSLMSVFCFPLLDSINPFDNSACSKAGFLVTNVLALIFFVKLAFIY